mmetsp:Transcript_49018/g.153993  ORF Transcript_49018/g.153993 Transcript_49018/m.153993 type:complete len:379 (+) Transcript_49018:38-1174(+)
MSVSRQQPPARPVAANRGDPLSRPVQRPLLQRLHEPRCGLSLGPHEPAQGGELPLLFGRLRQQNVRKAQQRHQLRVRLVDGRGRARAHQDRLRVREPNRARDLERGERRRLCRRRRRQQRLVAPVAEHGGRRRSRRLRRLAAQSCRTRASAERRRLDRARAEDDADPAAVSHAQRLHAAQRRAELLQQRVPRGGPRLFHLFELLGREGAVSAAAEDAVAGRVGRRDLAAHLFGDARSPNVVRLVGAPPRHGAPRATEASEPRGQRRNLALQRGAEPAAAGFAVRRQRDGQLVARAARRLLSSGDVRPGGDCTQQGHQPLEAACGGVARLEDEGEDAEERRRRPRVGAAVRRRERLREAEGGEGGVAVHLAVRHNELRA